MITLVIATIFITTILAGLFWFWWYQNYSIFFQKLNKIPGPKGHPIIGNTPYVSTEELFKKDRQRSRDYFPIYKQTLFNFGAVVLLHPKDIEIVLSSINYIRKSQMYKLLHVWLGTGLLTSRGKKWHSRRKILTPAFHFNILRQYVAIFNKETNNLVNELDKHIHEQLDIIFQLQNSRFILYWVATFNVNEILQISVTETSMGIKLDETSQKYKEAVCDFGRIATYRLLRPWLYNSSIFSIFSIGKNCKEVVETLHNYSRKVINERKNISRTHPNQTPLAMLDLLLAAQKNGENLSDEGIREEVDTFMFEGTDTTSTAIAFMLLLLANHSEIQETIYQEIIEIIGDFDTPATYATLQQLNYTERCIKESLRLYPSVPFIARESDCDIQTSTGCTIPKGAMIHIHIFDLHRNPQFYPDPEKFDPDRFLPENLRTRHPFAYIPFSAGPRNCIGQKFAILEMKAVLVGILRRFLLKPVDKTGDVVFITDMVLRAKNGIKVHFLRRK